MKHPGRIVFTCLLVACSGDASDSGDSGGRAPGGPPPEELSGVLITLDTTNRRPLDCYGQDRGITPFLKAFGDQSVVYTQARSVAPLTLVAHSSMLTGLYPVRHGVRENEMRPLPKSAETLAERADASGLETAAFVAAVVLEPMFGLEQGFDRYEAPRAVPEEGPFVFERGAEEVTADAVAWLRKRDPKRRFFLWVHYFDPHDPYTPLPEYRERAEGRGKHPDYLAEVARMDAAVGELLAVVDEVCGREKTLVMVVGDHGESLNEYGEEHHGILIYDQTIRVPLILRYPDGLRAGERANDVVTVADVFPTFVEGLGLGSVGDIDGLSLYRRTLPADRGVYFESYSGHLSFGWSPLTGWADARGSYLHSSKPALYGAKDAKQQKNILGEQPELAGAYRERIAELAGRERLEHGDVAISEEAQAKIRALGYAGGGDPDAEVPHPLEVEGLVWPEERIAEVTEFNRISQLPPDQSVAALRALLERNPDHALGREMLGITLASTGDLDGAVEVLLPFGDPAQMRRAGTKHLARSIWMLKRHEEALDIYRQANQAWPKDRSLAAELVQALQLLEKTDEARKIVESFDE